MKRMWMLGLLLVPVSAQAGNLGIVAMAPVRAQIKSEALAAKELSKGERLTVKTVKQATSSKPGLVQASIWVRGFNGPIRPGMKKTLQLQSTANFKVEQVSEGKLAVPVKRHGQIWQHYYHAL